MSTSPSIGKTASQEVSWYSEASITLGRRDTRQMPKETVVSPPMPD